MCMMMFVRWGEEKGGEGESCQGEITKNWLWEERRIVEFRDGDFKLYDLGRHAPLFIVNVLSKCILTHAPRVSFFGRKS